MSAASKRANGRASGPVLQSVFLAVIDHSARVGLEGEKTSHEANRKRSKLVVLVTANEVRWGGWLDEERGVGMRRKFR